MPAWSALILAGLFEVGFTTSMQLSSGFTHRGYVVLFAICVVLSFVLLAQASRTIPIGTAYAVWTGIGAAGTALIGMLFFREPAAFWRMFFLFMLIASIVGLRVVSTR
jgi:quaternary ammonium compound-resistance protein SugE